MSLPPSSSMNTNISASSAADPSTAANSDRTGGQPASQDPSHRGDGTAGTAASQNSVFTFYTGNKGNSLLHSPALPYNQEVVWRDSLSDIWKYTGNTIRFKNKTAAEHEVVQAWRKTCQVPLGEALQAFEAAMWKLHPGEGKLRYALQNNLKLAPWSEGEFQIISADSEETNPKLWDAWNAYCYLTGAPFDSIHNYYQQLPPDQPDQYNIWEMKRQCCREVCWKAREYLLDQVNMIVPGTLKWTPIKGTRNYDVEWTSEWNLAGNTPRASVVPSLVADDDDAASVVTRGEDWE